MDKRDIKYLKPKKTILEQVRSGLFKVALFLVLVPLIFLFLIPVSLSLFFGHDAEVVDDSDLTLPAIELPREENAFYDLEKIIKMFSEEQISYQEVVAYLNPENWNQAAVEQIVSDQQRSLQYFDSAADKEIFILPRMMTPGEDMETLDSLHSWRLVSQIASLRTLLLLQTGNDEQAFKSALAIIRVGHLIETSQTDLITYLTGLAIKENGLEVMAEVIRKTKVNIYRLAYYEDFLSEYNSKINISPLKQEYLMRKKGIEKISQGEIEPKGFGSWTKFLAKSNFYFKPNKTLIAEADRIRQLINYFEEPCYVEAPVIESKPMFSGLWSIPKLYFTENLVGKMNQETGQLALFSIKTKACENQAWLNGLGLMLDLKGYYLRQEELPVELGDLVPEETEKILNDPFSGIDFEYYRDEKKIYSVGRDHEMNTSDDIVLSVNFDEENMEEFEASQ